MSDTTKRPTREDIETARAMLNTAVMSGRRETVADILNAAELVTRYSRVLDYALDYLTAEQEAETAPAPAADACPKCGSEEVDATTARTVYACGSSDYDQRPGSFSQTSGCAALTKTVPADDEDVPQVEPPEDAKPAEPAPESDARLVEHLRAEGRT
jgi:hypothetical protein